MAIEDNYNQTIIAKDLSAMHY